MVLEEFFNEYFVQPVVNPAYQGYNIVNTAVYGAILLALAFFVIFPLLDRRGIKFNYRFCLGLIPYILAGTALRAIEAAGILAGIEKTMNPLEAGFWTFTPGVWFLTFAIVIFGLFFSRWLHKRKKAEFNTAFSFIGLVFSIPLLLFLFANFSNWLGFFAVIVAIAAVSFGIYFPLKFIPFTKKLATPFNGLVVSGQVIDSIATGFAIFFYGFTEQHPLSEAVLGVHPALFLALKVALVLAILYYVEKDIKRENLRGFVRVFLMILGFATGLASVLKIGLV